MTRKSILACTFYSHLLPITPILDTHVPHCRLYCHMLLCFKTNFGGHTHSRREYFVHVFIWMLSDEVRSSLGRNARVTLFFITVARILHLLCFWIGFKHVDRNVKQHFGLERAAVGGKKLSIHIESAHFGRIWASSYSVIGF